MWSRFRGDRLLPPNVLILMTSGQPDNPMATRFATQDLHASRPNHANLTIFSIAIGDGTNQDDLVKRIASKTSNFYSVGDFDALGSILSDLRNKICQVATGRLSIT